MVLSVLYHFLFPFVSIKWLRMVRSPIWYYAMYFNTHVFKVEDKVIKLKNMEDNISAWNLSLTLSFHVIEYFDIHIIISETKFWDLTKSVVVVFIKKFLLATKHNTQMKATALIHPDSLFPCPCFSCFFCNCFIFCRKVIKSLSWICYVFFPKNFEIFYIACVFSLSHAKGSDNWHFFTCLR